MKWCGLGVGLRVMFRVFLTRVAVDLDNYCLLLWGPRVRHSGVSNPRLGACQNQMYGRKDILGG